MPQRIQRKRTKGWRMPEGAVYVGRPGRWGNPYSVENDGTFMGQPLFRVVAGPTVAGVNDFYGGQKTLNDAAAQAVRLYRRWITGSAVRITDLVPLLGGRDLACWCPLDQPCHADVLLELANSEAPEYLNTPAGDNHLVHSTDKHAHVDASERDTCPDPTRLSTETASPGLSPVGLPAHHAHRTTASS